MNNSKNNEVLQVLSEIVYNYNMNPKIKIIDKMYGSYILFSEEHIKRIKNLIKELRRFK